MSKFMNNAVYGKTMEDVKKHMDFELIEEPKRYEKVAKSPFNYSYIINENLVGVEKIKPKVIFIGMSILDLSKNHMYGFFYDKLNPNLMMIQD